MRPKEWPPGGILNWLNCNGVALHEILEYELDFIVSITEKNRNSKSEIRNKLKNLVIVSVLGIRISDLI